MPISDPLVMPLARELLDCYRQELAKLENPPANIGFRFGASVDLLISTTRDECCEGTAWVRPDTFYPSSTGFPIQDATAQKQGTRAWAVTLDMGIAICAPTPSEHDIPSEAQNEDTLQAVMDAAAAMRRAICYFTDAAAGRAQKVLPGTWQWIQTEGGCTGGVLPVTVMGPVCDCKDAGPVSS